MLKSLSIHNFAIIETAQIDFEHGMTVFSGETGAGKSIIIDAIGILCGGRGSNDFIRQGADRLRVEGLFHFTNPYPELLDQLQHYGLEIDLLHDDLVIQREINVTGKNTIRINGHLANVTMLKAVGTYLVDIHGQNEHQSLLDKDQHLKLLDSHNIEAQEIHFQAYHEAFTNYNHLRKKWLAVHVQDQNQAQRLQFLEFQIQEIEAAQLISGQEEELEALSRKMQNSQMIHDNLSAINSLMSENEVNILGQMQTVNDLLKTSQAHLPELTPIQASLQSNLYDLQELAHHLASLARDETDDSQTIDEVEARLNELGQLKHKFGMSSIEAIIAYYHEISEEIYQLQHKDKYLHQLSEDLKEAYQKALDQAKYLHTYRQAQAEQLAKAIQIELADLYMPNCRFEVIFEEPVKDQALQLVLPDALIMTPTGFDSVEFYAATNLGEPLKPLVRVASGGELSRFMLAIKRVFSLSLVPKTMIFDEIDSGVSGRVAQAIAEKMLQIAKSHQVLCITHLAQVTAIAHHHLYITKSIANDRTYTKVAILDETEREAVIAQMLSGKAVSDTSKQMARELMSTLHALH